MANSAFTHDPQITVPGSSTDNAIVIFDGTAGTGFGNSTILVDSGGNGRIGIAADVDLLALASGALTVNGTITATGFTIGSAVLIEAELEMLDGITAGTAAASKAVVLDSSTNITGIGTIGSGAITSTGVVTATGFTIGSAAITEAELEILDGATVTTAELNFLAGVSGLAQSDFTKLAAIDSTAAEINLLDALDRGSILYGNASGVTTVLGQGTTDQILTSDGNDIAWQDAAGGVGCGPLRIANGSASAPAYSFANDTDTGYFLVEAGVHAFSSGNSEKFRIAGSVLFTGDTANGNMSQGLTINQACKDDHILTFKSTDLNSGSSSLYDQNAETDDYATFSKLGATTGGLRLQALAGGHPVFRLDAWAGGQCTGKSTSSIGVITLAAHRHNTGNSKDAFPSNSNLVAIVADDTCPSNAARFLFDLEGTAHADVGWGTYDDYCDIELMRGMLAETVPCYREKFGQDMMYNLCHYTDMKLIGKDSVHWEQRPCGKMQQRAMINFTGLTMLHHSTIIQMHDNLQTIIQSQEQRISQLENQLALGGK